MHAREPARTDDYIIGVMKAPVENRDSSFNSVVDAAVPIVEDYLSRERVNLRAHLFEFVGPHLSPVAGTYSPLDFLQIGLTEKVERRLHFLLVLTEVDLAATSQSYTLALPSQITNVAIISTKRLMPRFWGHPDDRDAGVRRLTSLMLHSIGHLLNVRHSGDPSNIMFDFVEIEDLEKMRTITPDQIAEMKRNLPTEARERVSRGHPWRFAVVHTLRNAPSIARTVARANPLRLALRLPAVLTAALSVDVLLFFTAEIWDAASSMALVELGIFSIIALVAATAVLYRSFGLSPEKGRGQLLAESVVVTRAATILTLLLTLLALYAVFFLLSWAAIVLIFPERLMATWPTIDPAVRTLDHIKLSTFLGAMGALVGSLGGTAERKDIVRSVLFLDEET